MFRPVDPLRRTQTLLFGEGMILMFFRESKFQQLVLTVGLPLA
jgi:hypothetical protein